MRRLEEATGLSRGAIFHHFRDKDSLFLAVAEDDAAAMVDTVARNGLVQVMRDLLDPAPSRPDDHRLAGQPAGGVPPAAHRPGVRPRWAERSAAIAEATRDRLGRQREAGVLREDVDRSTCWPSSWSWPTTAWCCTWRWAGPAGDLGRVLDLVEDGGPAATDRAHRSRLGAPFRGEAAPQ